jgi:hypothetical protein
MAFPGTYNFNYYVGDTFQFRIYPKDASGAPFDLSGYDLTSGAKFTIATTRGSEGVASHIDCDAEISADRTYVECSIFPEEGTDLDENSNYVYDVEISKVEGTSPNQKTYTYTLLTGTISVTDQISGA